MKPRVLMWMNYRRNRVGRPTIAVPSPADGNASVPWWYDRIAMLAGPLAAAGVTDVLLPSPLMTQSGAYPTGDGYGPYDDYDIGSKGAPTRFGPAERCRRAVAVCHANGLDVHLDHVMHQRNGGRGGVYRYRSATGADNGRFPKHPTCFRGGVAQDPVPAPADDFSFGDELAPVNAVPHRYVWNGLIDAGDWLFRTIGVDGARLDDMKGLAVEFMRAFVSSKAMNGKFFFGEYASGNRDDTNGWVGQMDGRASAIDFDFHYNAAQPMCNGAGSGSFFMGSLAGRGMVASNPMKAVPFVESMDSDTNGFATIVHNKLLGYALMLGGEGLPLVYIRDYLNERDCYGLQPAIDNLLWCHQMLANGPTVPRLASHPRVYVFERTGPPGLLVSLNNDVFNRDWYTVTVQTEFGAGVRLHDYSGHNPIDAWTDGQGRVTFGVPPGADGQGYGMWSRSGLDRALTSSGRSTTQTFFGAADLDTDRVRNGASLSTGRVWCAPGTRLQLALRLAPAPGRDASVALSVLGPDHAELLHHRWSAAAPGPVGVVIPARGWYAPALRGDGLPAAGSDFELAVTYTATPSL